MKKVKQDIETLKEIWKHTKPSIQKNKKKYTRKNKHKGNDSSE